MYSKILVPLDGSSLSEQVLPHAQKLSQCFDAPVDFVCAVEIEEVPEAIVADAQQDCGKYLQRIADSSALELKPGCVVKPGIPAEVILDQAEAEEGTLIVMATHGYSGLQRWILGSVAHKVVQAATTPVLLIPAGAKSPEGGMVEFERIIVPLDGSPAAEHILPYATALCKAFDSEIILLRAYIARFPGSTIRMHEVTQIVRDSAENYLQEKVRQLQSNGVEKVSYEVLHGIPAEQITDFALRTPNSLTAMCTHGRHGVGRWLLGSVTDAVIHSSEEPVLVIRTPHEPN